MAEVISIYGGHGIEWCSRCGALRRLLFTNLKTAAGQVVKKPWRIPACSLLSDTP